MEKLVMLEEWFGRSLNGITEKCYNLGNVTGKGSSVGGIVGSDGLITKECFNGGNIRGNNNIGGINGRNYGGTVSNCYNYGNIEGNEKGSYGAITGANYKTISNCYTMKLENLSGIWYAGTQLNSYFFSETSINAKAKKESFMKTQDFVDLLNTVTTTTTDEETGETITTTTTQNIWKMDTNNINNGFPILEWQN